MIYLISGEDSKLVDRAIAVLSQNAIRENSVNVLVLHINHDIIISEFTNTTEMLTWHRILSVWRHLNITIFIPTTRHHLRISKFVRDRYTHLIKITDSDPNYIYGLIIERLTNKESKLRITKEWEKGKLTKKKTAQKVKA